MSVAAQFKGDKVSKRTRRLSQNGVERNSVHLFGPVPLGAGLFPVDTNSLPTFAGLCEATALEYRRDLPVTRSVLAVASPVAGQADAADVLEWQGIRFRQWILITQKW